MSDRPPDRTLVSGQRACRRNPRTAGWTNLAVAGSFVAGSGGGGGALARTMLLAAR